MDRRIEIRMIKDFTFTKEWDYMLPERIGLELVARGYAEFIKPVKEAAPIRYKVEWVDADGKGQEDEFEDLVTTLDFMNVIQNNCCMADVYWWDSLEWQHL